MEGQRLVRLECKLGSWKKQKRARPKCGRPLQNLPATALDGFVAADPSRAFRDGPGILMVLLQPWAAVPSRAKSPDQLETELDRTRPSCSEHGIGSGLVRRIASAPEIAGVARRGIVEPGIGGPVGIGEVRVVENIEKLGAELGRKAFLDFRILDQGQIPVLESQIGEDIAPNIPNCSQSGRE